ncbi:hypothetical protein SAMN04488557_0367 [Hyphomicrobium facile]|uniref:Uncharacterized protein n=1 Tax=Hyphomicrobium facile TaxID=51670 RepID=A0A1I7MUV5_9HYPH|nr:hypothetical protein SAMN04488557_0367 [Hyphomicrobium facile]
MRQLVTKWLIDEFQALAKFDAIFFAVEKHSVVPDSLGYPEFHFTYQGTIIEASLEPVDRVAGRSAAKASTAYADWTDGGMRLEDCECHSDCSTKRRAGAPRTFIVAA